MLYSSRLSLVQKANSLVVLSGLLHAASRVARAAAVETPSEVLSALTQALSSEEMRASEHPAIRNQLLAVATNIMRWLGPRWGREAGCQGGVRADGQDDWMMTAKCLTRYARLAVVA